MKILLVNPPNSGKNIIEEKYGISLIRETFKGEPLSLEVLAGNLREEAVDIFDMKADNTPYEQKLKEFTPDLVGITAMTCEANAALRILKETKAYSPKIVTVAGGIHATINPEFFNQPFVDYVVIGIGKKTLALLVGYLKHENELKEIPGLGVQNNGKFCVSPQKTRQEDLLEEVLPARELVKKYKSAYYLNNFNISIDFVDTAYGCTNRCSFCCLWSITGGKYLAKTPQAVVRDIGFSESFCVRLVDANTFGNSRRAKEIASLIKQNRINKLFVVDARADTIARQPELIGIWKEIGLKAVVVGFEEIEDIGLRGFNKRTTADINTRAINILHENGINIIGDFIVSPEYEETDFDKLSDYVGKHKIELPGFSVLTPLPGTPIYEQFKEQIIIDNLDYYTLTNAVIRTKLSEKRFYQRLGQLYKRFYSQSLPKRLLSRLIFNETAIKTIHSAKKQLRRVFGC